MEQFKKLDEILQPDLRSTMWVVTGPTGTRSVTIEDEYRNIESIRLNDSVPEDVKSQFNIAKNLGVYTWFCYPFHQICEMKAYATVEYAIRERYSCHKTYGKKDKVESFRNLLKRAIGEGMLKDSGFSHLQRKPDNNENTWVKRLPEFIADFRNDLAHGSKTLDFSSSLTLRICADLINQVFN